MTIKNEYVTLDGEVNGITVEALLGGRKRWIQSREKYIRRFKNVAIAETTAKSIVRNIDARFFYYIAIGDKQFSLDDCQKVKDHWEVFDNNIRYIIKEDNEKTITRLGYIVFEDGDTVRCDKTYGIKRRKELMTFVKDVCSNIFYYDDTEYKIRKIEKRDHEIVLHIVNTATIHIMTNSKLMDINQVRKNQEMKCIPFIKNMDKYTTLYIYACKDSAETDRIGSDRAVDEVTDYIIGDLQYFYKDLDPKYVPVDFSAHIVVKEDYQNDKNGQIR